MLKGYEKLNIVDTSDKPTGLTIDVNWRPEDSATNECKILRMKFPDGSEHFVKRDVFMAFLWAIGRPEEQRQMIPQTLSKMKWYETVVSVKATKDIHKGEKITFPIKLSLPAEKQEVIGGVKKADKSKILTP